jgi:hypothetical protein
MNGCSWSHLLSRAVAVLVAVCVGAPLTYYGCLIGAGVLGGLWETTAFGGHLAVVVGCVLGIASAVLMTGAAARFASTLTGALMKRSSR